MEDVFPIETHGGAVWYRFRAGGGVWWGVGWGGGGGRAWLRGALLPPPGSHRTSRLRATVPSRGAESDARLASRWASWSVASCGNRLPTEPGWRPRRRLLLCRRGRGRRHARRRQRHRVAPCAHRSTHPSCNRSTIGVTVATSLDHVEPLELTSLRDDAPVRPPWSARATGTLALAFAAAVIVTLALLISEEPTFGAGRVLGVVIGAWCLCALFVAMHRPPEPLAVLMVLGALVGAFALFGAALSVRDAATLDANDWGAAIRAIAVAILPAVGLQLALGLPTDRCDLVPESCCGAGVRRVRGAGRVPAPRAARRPGRAHRGGGGGVRGRGDRGVLRTLPRGPQCPRAGATPVGCVGRGRGRRDLDRGRGLALAGVVAGARARRRGRDHGADPVVVGTGGVGADRGANRPLARAHHHPCRARGDGRGVLPPHRARARPLADRRRADPARPVDARRRSRGAALDPGARATHRSRDASGLRRTSRARRGAPNVRQPADARAAARRVVATARGVVEEDDGVGGRRGVDAGHRRARARGVGTRARCRAYRDRRRGGARGRPRRRVGSCVGEDLVARGARR